MLFYKEPIVSDRLQTKICISKPSAILFVMRKHGEMANQKPAQNPSLYKKPKYGSFKQTPWLSVPNVL